MGCVKPHAHTFKSKSCLNSSFKNVKTRFLSSKCEEKLEFLGAIVGVRARNNMLGHGPIQGQ